MSSFKRTDTYDASLQEVSCFFIAVVVVSIVAVTVVIRKDSVLLFTKTTTKYRNYYEIPELPKLPAQPMQ